MKETKAQPAKQISHSCKGLSQDPSAVSPRHQAVSEGRSCAGGKGDSARQLESECLTGVGGTDRVLHLKSLLRALDWVL